jgi:hypothetical protein
MVLLPQAEVTFIDLGSSFYALWYCFYQERKKKKKK